MRGVHARKIAPNGREHPQGKRVAMWQVSKPDGVQFGDTLKWSRAELEPGTLRVQPLWQPSAFEENVRQLIFDRPASTAFAEQVLIIQRSIFHAWAERATQLVVVPLHACMHAAAWIYT